MLQHTVTNQKIKLFLLIDLLKKYSDENHPLSAPEIIKLLNSRGMSCERKYIYNVFDTLSDYGFDIIRTYQPKQGFYLGERNFELAEIKILIDAVSSAPFISPKKSKELIKKLENQLSIYQSETVTMGIHNKCQMKIDNEEIYYSIDTANEAICRKKKISFRYHHTILKDSCITNDDGKDFIVSPYALIWNNDRYYLVGNYEKYNNISHFRVDRMKKVNILNDDAQDCPESLNYIHNGEFDIDEYAKKTFGMFSGKTENIELICDNCMFELIVDKFGADVKIQSYSSKQFKACITLSWNKLFVSWLIDYADKIYVDKPESLRETVKDKINDIYRAYFQKESPENSFFE